MVLPSADVTKGIPGRGLAAAACVIFLLALILPWAGFDFAWGRVNVHIHSLKNPLAVFLLLAALRSRIIFDRLDRWVLGHPHLVPWGGSTVTGLLITNAKLLQHFSLQTHAFDLGIFANVCWNTLHGRFLYDSIKGAPYLADHFQPILLILAPALLLWKDAAVLLIIQSMGIALGVPPLFWMAVRKTGSGALAVGLCLVYATAPYLADVSIFDFHPIALSIPTFLWALYFLETERRAAFWVMCGIGLILKEDVPLALVAWGGLLAFTRKEWRWAGFILIFVSAISFAVETQIVIPYFLKEVSSVHLSRYGYLGQTYGEILTHLVRKPQLALNGFLFPLEKWRSVFKYFLYLGFLPWFSPAHLIPVGGALLPHLLSLYPGQYTLSAQYTALSLPFAFTASLEGLTRILKWLDVRKRFLLLSGLLGLSGLALLSESRYASPPDWGRTAEFYELIRNIPPDASVRAQSDLLPHLCLRQEAFLLAPYEWFKDLPLFEASRIHADYIVIDRKGNHWPMDENQYKERLRRLETSDHRELVKQKGSFELWKRNPT